MTETVTLTASRGDSLVFGGLDGSWLHPERFSGSFESCLARCRAELAGQGVEPPAEIRLHA